MDGVNIVYYHSRWAAGKRLLLPGVQDVWVHEKQVVPDPQGYPFEVIIAI